MEEEAKQIESALHRLFQQLLPILQRLLGTRKNFKVTINVNAGHKFRIEAVEFFDEI